MSYLFDAVHFLPMTAVLAAAAYLPLAILLHVKKKPYPWIRHLCNYLLAGYLAALLYVTFFWAVTRSDLPLSDRLHPLPGDSFRFALQYDGGLWSSQIMWNVCLFMPLGGLLPCVFRTLFVGRVADADDLICNTLGAVFGRALYTAAAWAFKKVKAFAPVLEDHVKTPGHIAALAAMALILLVPTALDVINRLLPNGIFPVA